MKWFENSWSDLTPDQVHAMIRLRLDVFVVEQDCVYSDLDGKDLQSIHLWAQNEKHEAGDAADAVVRLVPPGVSYDVPSIGRVVSRSALRGTGLGQELMERAVRACQRLWPNQAIQISAQQYLIKFYESFGFVVMGEGYLEDNIPHIGMVRPGCSWDEEIKKVSDAASDFERTFRNLGSANQNVSDGGWSKKEVLSHLIRSDQSLFAYMTKKAQANPASLPACDLESDGRGVLLLRDLVSDRRWKVPTGALLIQPAATDESIPDEELLRQWIENRNSGFAQMKIDFSHESWWSVQIFRHPSAGYLSLFDTLVFMAAHTRHHIRQLHRLKGGKTSLGS